MRKSKKTAKPGKSSPLPAGSKTLAVELTARFQREAARLSAAEKELVSAALRDLPNAIGQPHIHAGLGICRLRGDLFECRAGRRLRVLFFAAPGRLTCYSVSDHDGITNLIKNLR